MRGWGRKEHRYTLLDMLSSPGFLAIRKVVDSTMYRLSLYLLFIVLYS